MIDFDGVQLVCSFCDCDATTVLARGLGDGSTLMMPVCEPCAALRMMLAFAARTDTLPGVN